LTTAQAGSDEETFCLNSMIYYGVDYLRIRKVDDSQEVPAAEIKRALRLIEPMVNFSSSVNVLRLDTICRAYVFFDRPAEAVQVAERVQAVMSALDASKFDLEEQDMLSFATRIIESKGMRSAL